MAAGEGEGEAEDGGWAYSRWPCDSAEVLCGWGSCQQRLNGDDVRLCAEHLVRAWVLLEVGRRAAPAERVLGRRGSKRAELHTLVYYVRLRSGRIMIGHTTDLLHRLPTFDLPAEAVLAVEPGGLAWELMRHEQFAPLRVSLLIEEFDPSPELLVHISAVRSAWGEPWYIARELAAVNHRLRTSLAR